MAGKVGAPKGNKNAEKWNLEESEKLLLKALDLADKKTTIKKIVGKEVVQFEAYEFDFIGEIACELDVYHELITRDIPERFPELKPIVKQLVGKLERNCYSNVKKENINVAVGIVNLKSNHKWTDRQEVDHTTKGDKLDAPQIIVTNSEVAKSFEDLKNMFNQDEVNDNI